MQYRFSNRGAQIYAQITGAKSVRSQLAWVIKPIACRLAEIWFTRVARAHPDKAGYRLLDNIQGSCQLKPEREFFSHEKRDFKPRERKKVHDRSSFHRNWRDLPTLSNAPTRRFR